MRAARLMNLLLLLETRRQATARQLAGELEVSVRTVHRDIEALSAGGIPIYAERGARGGFRLLEGYAVRLAAFTAGEIAALRLLGLPGVAAELGWGADLRAAELKLQNALPAGQRDLFSRSGNVVHIDLRAGDRTPQAHLHALLSAIEHRRALRLLFAGTAERVEIEPLGLVRNWEGWNVVARQDERMVCVALADISEITSVARHFLRPETFDLTEEWRRLRNA